MVLCMAQGQLHLHRPWQQLCWAGLQFHMRSRRFVCTALRALIWPCSLYSGVFACIMLFAFTYVLVLESLIVHSAKQWCLEAYTHREVWFCYLLLVINIDLIRRVLLVRVWIQSFSGYTTLLCFPEAGDFTTRHFHDFIWLENIYVLVVVYQSQPRQSSVQLISYHLPYLQLYLQLKRIPDHLQV